MKYIISILITRFLCKRTEEISLGYLNIYCLTYLIRVSYQNAHQLRRSNYSWRIHIFLRLNVLFLLKEIRSSRKFLVVSHVSQLALFKTI